MRAGEGSFVGVSFLVCAILLGCGGRSEPARGKHGSGGAAGVGGGGGGDAGKPGGNAHPRLTSSKLDLGLRQLELLRELGDSSIVGSICPRNLEDPSRDDYAYRPAVHAIMDRMQDVLRDATD